MTDIPDETLVEKAARALFAEEQCTKSERENLEANWSDRLSPEDRAEYRDLVRPAIAAVVPDIRAQALRDAADAWQCGEWADAPRYRDQVRERIATAQHVTDWLRARAEVGK